ncbi:MAG: fumarate/nitrate reduction transcriptional regulator Fnr [Gammaproteobacteria bacterium]|nr:fumarate/nitrate reduction transcriptional regulator Fnr [Gammaproteobacteria bacterium]MDH5650256.1 fumarate/nitrate reduction transcriptional regulator Fnr [Gammaproteobacteria bacterium]
MKDNNVIELSAIRTTCQSCGLYQLCLPMGLDQGDMDKLDKVIKRQRKIERGDHLYRMRESFTTVYALRSGSVKTYSTIENGQEQVTGFHLPGELLGLNAVSTKFHTDSAIALETSSVCEIPFDRLENLSHEIPSMHHHLLHVMSEEIQHDHCQLMMIAKMPAEARLARFLLSLSYHFSQRGFSSTKFNLSMSRNDIANLLGLAVETVSRLFSHFQDEGLLTVERKSIEIHDMDGLMNVTTKCASHPLPGKSPSSDSLS